MNYLLMARLPSILDVKQSIFALILCSVMFSYTPSVSAQWSNHIQDENRITTLPADHSNQVVFQQNNTTYVSFTVKNDSTNDDDLYMQALDEDGFKLWDTVGVLISDAMGSQWQPQIIAGPSESLVNSWFDETIYAQRVNATGDLLWDSTGIHCHLPPSGSNIAWSLTGSEYNMVKNETGGALFFWTQTTKLTDGTHIYSAQGQKIDSLGQRLWKHGILDSFNSYKTFFSSDVTLSNINTSTITQNGDFYISFIRNKGANKLHAQKIDNDGNIIWSDSLALADYLLDIARGANDDIYFSYSRGDSLFLTKADSAGDHQWHAAIAYDSDGVSESKLSLHPDGDLVIAWRQDRSSGAAVHVNKISASGQIQWTNDAKLTSSYSKLSDLAVADNGLIYTSFTQGSFYPSAYVGCLNTDGSPAWVNSSGTKFNVKLHHGPNTFNERGNSPKLAATSDDDVIVTWSDNRYPGTDYHVYVNKVLQNSQLPMNCTNTDTITLGPNYFNPIVSGTYQASSVLNVDHELNNTGVDLILKAENEVNILPETYIGIGNSLEAKIETCD